MTTVEHVAQTGQLLRLRALREDAARAEVERCRMRRDECAQIVERRRTQIERVRVGRGGLIDWLSGVGAHELPRVAPYARARLAALDDELERATLELVDEAADLQRAERTLAAAQAGWAQARARREAVEEQNDAAKRGLSHEREQRAERELEARSAMAWSR